MKSSEAVPRVQAVGDTRVDSYYGSDLSMQARGSVGIVEGRTPCYRQPLSGVKAVHWARTRTNDLSLAENGACGRRTASRRRDGAKARQATLHRGPPCGHGPQPRSREEPRGLQDDSSRRRRSAEEASAARPQSPPRGTPARGPTPRRRGRPPPGPPLTRPRPPPPPEDRLATLALVRRHQVVELRHTEEGPRPLSAPTL